MSRLGRSFPNNWLLSQLGQERPAGFYPEQPSVFPLNPIPFKLEMLINGTWEDISAYVQQRSNIEITRGIPDETQNAEPAAMTVTLDNRDGRFSIYNTSGAYYPYLMRNVQVRLSIQNASSAAGQLYTGYRFWGELSSAPPSWDVTGNDVYVNIQVYGPFRRYIQSPVTNSPMLQALLGQQAPVNCIALWPCEDGSDSSQPSSAIAGASPMTVTAGLPGYASVTPMVGATLPLISIGSSQFQGAPPSGYAFQGNVVVRFLVDLTDTPASGDKDTILQLTLTGSGGSIGFINFVLCNPSDFSSTDVALQVLGYSSGPTLAFGLPSESSASVDLNSTLGVATGNRSFWVSLEVRSTTGGSETSANTGTVYYSCDIMAANGTTAVSMGSASFSGDVGTLTGIFVNPYGVDLGSGIGMISFQTGWQTMYDFTAYLSAFNGETAAARLQRLCDYNNLSFELIGSDTTPQMGPQQIDTLLDQFQACMDMDRGILYESVDQLGVAYRTRESMQNQSPSLTTAYTDKTLSEVPAPTADDQYLRNQVTMQQVNGGSATVQLASGAMSVQYPPDGIGPYPYSDTVNAYSDSQLTDLAQWVMDVGTVNEYRFPQLTFNLARPEAAGVFADVAGTDIGDYLEVTSPPSFLQAGSISQIAFGYTETISNFEWDISFNTVPEDPYTGEDLPTW